MISSLLGNSRLSGFDMKKSIKLYACIFVIFLLVKNVRSLTEEIDVKDEKIEKRYQVAHFNFEEVSSVYAITLWILLGSLAKIGSF